MVRRTVAAVALCVWLHCAATTATSAAPKSPQAPSDAGVLRDVTLPQRSPLSSIEESFWRTPRQFTGRKVQTFEAMTAAEREALDYDLSKESVDVVVPATLSTRAGASSPSSSSAPPYGLLVWLGVSAPEPQWFPSLAKRRLILVTPNRCDGRSPWLKRGLALDAVHNLSRQYNVDPARVYLGGFSAGAHASSALVVQFPDVFRGALCLMGGHYYLADRRLDARGKPGPPEATVIGPRWYGDDVERLKRDLRLVSVFGAADDVVLASQGRIDHECLRLDGFQHAYIETRGGHRHPDPGTFQRALAALEAKPARPPTTGPSRPGQPPHADQLAQSKRLLTTAKMVYERVSRAAADPAGRARLRELAANDPAYDAALGRRCLTDLLANYPSTPAATEAGELSAKFDALPAPPPPAIPVTPPATRPTPTPRAHASKPDHRWECGMPTLTVL